MKRDIVSMFLSIFLIIFFTINLNSSVTSSNNVNSKQTESLHRKIEKFKLNSDVNIGTANDNEMKNFSPLSSHGRREANDISNDEEITVIYRFKIILRIVQHIINFFPVLFTSLIAFISPYYRNFIWYPLLRNALGNSGAAFIKWGQWSSTRPDMFPEELCKALQELQANAPEHNYKYTEYLINNNFGKSIDEIFDQFDRSPIASGSIAQVYRAILNGQDVAVKVRHPNVNEQIKLDFIIMKGFANMLDQFNAFKWLNLPESMAQFSSTIASQTRLDIEGRHLVLFNRYFHKWESASFPQPIMFTDGVLVESYEYGESVAKFSNRMSDKRKNNEVITRNEMILSHFIVNCGEDVYLKMLLEDNLMHADLHPGNILIQQSHVITTPITTPNEIINTPIVNEVDSTNNLIVQDKQLDIKVNNKIVLVDAGMVAALLPEERNNFIGLLEALGEGLGDEAAEYVINFSINNKNYSNESKQLFKQDMVKLFSKICKGYHTVVNLGDVLRGILNLIRIHRIAIDSNYATLIINAMCLESLANVLVPEYNVLDGAKTLLQFHRFSRHIPLPFIDKLVFKVGLPIAQWLKRINDEKFVKKLF